jgi:ribosomal protein L40E
VDGVPCSKCGAENPEDNIFCSSCGARFSEVRAKDQECHGADVSSQSPKDQPSQYISINRIVRVLVILGALILIVGTFLPWDGVLGIMIPQGAVLCLIGVLSISALVMSRSGADRSWNMVMLLLAALSLALIFQTFYMIKDYGDSIMVGSWVALMGSLIITVGSLIGSVATIRK